MTEISSQTHAFFATCPRNTEGLLLQELRGLGASDAAETRAGVSFTGPLGLAYRACLWSRVASRVLLSLVSFPVSTVEDLYSAAHDLAWEDHLTTDGTLAVDVTSAISRGPLTTLNTHFAEQRVKDAVVDRFRARYGSRPGVDLARPDVRINVHLSPSEGSDSTGVISLDLSGDSLHRRGYRLGAGEAPLKENLAASILLRAGWPKVAASGGALLDPMCRSRTLLIEGAWIAGDIAPGMMRDHFGFLTWKQFEPSAWRDTLREAEERRDEGLKSLPSIYGYDVQQRALGAARANARRAGLAGRIAFERRALDALVAPPQALGGGLVVTNPPYGKRLGEVEALVSTYETLGEKLKESFSGWQTAVFTGNPALGAHLGLRARRLNTLYNGPLECKLLLFDIGLSEVVGERASRGGATEQTRPTERTKTSAAEEKERAEMLANRLRKNQKRLRSWLARNEIHCYRVYDADLPEYALAIDLYEDQVHVQEYAPPSTVDPVRARRRLKAALSVIPEALGVPEANVVLKVRRQQKGPEQYRKLDDRGRFFEVTEGGLRFLINLTDYLDTGLFLDHRPTRGIIRAEAAGKRFLNLFAYTGSATVYAAAGGAASTTSIDLSSTYLDWARRNMELNGFTEDRHGYLRADCLAWLTSQAEGSEVYDLIFLDAPTFSNSKGMEQDLDIQRDHAGLVRAAARLLSRDGTLLFSTNYRRFKLDPSLEQILEVTDITKQTIPTDFLRNPRIHRCFRLTPPQTKDPH